MRSKILAALQHIVLADRTIHDSGNLKTYIERKELKSVLEIADCWYNFPMSDKGREAIKMAIDMGRTAHEHTIYRVVIKDKTFIYFIGTEDSIIDKLDSIPDKKVEEKEQKALPKELQNMSDQTSPKLSD